jgi:hypothetical protein
VLVHVSMQFVAGTFELETDTLRAFISCYKVARGRMPVENAYHFRIDFEALIVLAKEPFPFEAC